MARISELHLNILQKIFTYFYRRITAYPQGISQFKQLLPSIAVCRVWRECMLPYVYRTAYLEYYIKETHKDGETAQSEYEWKSNIGLIASQRLSSASILLRIESLGCPLEFSNLIHALDTFDFSSSHWRAVNALYITAANEGAAVNDNSPSFTYNEALAAQLTDYFGRHLPNISDLSIQASSQLKATRLLSNRLVNLYISQLHTLYCFPIPITFNCHLFSSRLRYLYVRIASGVTNRLPQLLASPLKELHLFGIPQNFAWWTFIGITPAHIEFTNLRKLTLSFRQLSESEGEPDNSNSKSHMTAVSFDIGHRKLLLPKLTDLRIFDSPYNDGALYSMFVHSPLQTVYIQSSFKSVQHMDPHILFNTTDVRFTVHGVSPDDYNDYVDFYCKLLGTPSNARTAWLRVPLSSVPLPIPSTIEWTNLKNLILEVNIYFASAIQVITQLQKLQKLKVENIVDEFDEAGTNLRVILGGNSTQMPSIAANLKSIWIYSARRLPVVFSLDVMRYLTVLIQSLDKVIVPDLYISDIKEFAVRYTNSFPHLRDVKVFGASEENDT